MPRQARSRFPGAATATGDLAHRNRVVTGCHPNPAAGIILQCTTRSTPLAVQWDRTRLANELPPARVVLLVPPCAATEPAPRAVTATGMGSRFLFQ